MARASAPLVAMATAPATITSVVGAFMLNQVLLPTGESQGVRCLDARAIEGTAREAPAAFTDRLRGVFMRPLPPQQTPPRGVPSHNRAAMCARACQLGGDSANPAGATRDMVVLPGFEIAAVSFPCFEADFVLLSE